MSNVLGMTAFQVLDTERTLTEATRHRTRLHCDLEDLFHQVGGAHAKHLEIVLQTLEELDEALDMIWDEVVTRQEELEELDRQAWEPELEDVVASC